MAYSALELNTNALYQAVNQVAHGFSVGSVVRWNGTAFVLANNSSILNAGGIVMVSTVVNTDQFYVTQDGFVSGLTTAPSEGGAYTPGTTYYLSATSGLMTAVKPTTVGRVLVACYEAYSATSGFFFGGFGDLIESPTAFLWSTVTVDTPLVTNQGYFANSVGNINFTLPTIFSVGDVIQIAAINVGTITVLQNAGQSIILGSGGATTVGAGGSLAGGAAYQSLELIGAVANTVLYCKPPFGTFLAT